MDVRDGLWVWGVGVCVGSVGFVVNIQEGFGGGGVRDGLWVWGVRVCGGSVRFMLNIQAGFWGDIMVCLGGEGCGRLSQRSVVVRTRVSSV